MFITTSRRQYTVPPNQVPLYINGNLTNGDNPPFNVTSPWINEPTPHPASNASVEQALQAAEAVGTSGIEWSTLSPLIRRDFLLKAAHNFAKSKTEHIKIVSHEMGAPPALAEYFFNDSLQYLVEMASRTVTAAEGTIAVGSKGRLPLVFSEPVGPVLAMAPWNAASILAMRSVATPLAAGCPVVFKASDRSPASHWSTLKCFTDAAGAGLPSGTFNFLTTAADSAPAVVDALISSRHIRKINFTGSTDVGRRIAISAATHLKPVVLELGGKCASIIDGNNLSAELVEKAVDGVLFGAWHGNGQICMSTERVYVVGHEFYNEFVDLLRKRAGETPLLHFNNEGTSSGGGHPMSSKEAVEGYYGLVRDAISKGARLVAGQLSPSVFTSSTSSSAGANAFVTKTILADVTPSMSIFNDESFGPVACVYPVSSLSEAITLSNASDYGLSASVWTQDVAKGIAVAKALHSGAVHVNGSTIHDEATMPHGGIKGSGYGRFGARWGVSEYTMTKSVTIPEVSL